MNINLQLSSFTVRSKKKKGQREREGRGDCLFYKFITVLFIANIDFLVCFLKKENKLMKLY